MGVTPLYSPNQPQQPPQPPAVTPPAGTPAPVAPAQGPWRPGMPPRAVPDAPKRSDGGCLRGCLVAMGVVMLLLILVVASLLLFGRPYIANHLPQWRAENDMLDIVVSLTGVDRYFVPKAQVLGTSGRKPGREERQSIPVSIVLYTDPIGEAVNASADEVTVYQQVPLPADAAADFWRQGMEEHGWKLSLDQVAADSSRQLFWDGDGWVCRAEIVSPEQSPTEVWLRCGHAAPTPAATLAETATPAG